MSEITTTMLDQIGHWNVAAISGGRVQHVDDTTLDLPVGKGYHVEVRYDFGSDTYTVRRVFVRRARGAAEPTRHAKGELSGVYCDELGEVAYRASCFYDPFPLA